MVGVGVGPIVLVMPAIRHEVDEGADKQEADAHADDPDPRPRVAPVPAALAQVGGIRLAQFGKGNVALRRAHRRHHGPPGARRPRSGGHGSGRDADRARVGRRPVPFVPSSCSPSSRRHRPARGPSGPNQSPLISVSVSNLRSSKPAGRQTSPSLVPVPRRRAGGRRESLSRHSSAGHRAFGSRRPRRPARPAAPGPPATVRLRRRFSSEARAVCAPASDGDTPGQRRRGNKAPRLTSSPRVICASSEGVIRRRMLSRFQRTFMPCRLSRPSPAGRHPGLARRACRRRRTPTAGQSRRPGRARLPRSSRRAGCLGGTGRRLSISGSTIPAPMAPPR